MKGKTKTEKLVKFLKAAFKATEKIVNWSRTNLTVGMVVKGGLILLVVGTLIRGALFG